MFLKVPFAEKEEAKALGARWNGERKSWYVPDGKPTEPFERWLPAGGADFVPAKAAASIKGKPMAAGAGAPAASVDSYIGKTVVGKHYIALEHACSPFSPCADCAPALQKSGWQAAHDAACAMLAAARG
jgi:hypothetical protein